MSSPPPAAQIASSMFPQYVSYGDIVFIVLPLIPSSDGYIINGLAEDGIHVSAIQGDISNGDPYIIDQPSGPPTSQAIVPQPIYNNSQIRLRRYNSGNQGVWVNASDDNSLQVATASANDDHATWTIVLENATSSDQPITYQDRFSLRNAYRNQYVNLNTTWSSINGNMEVDDGLSGSNPYGTFSFLYGPQSMAQLQCCTNNTAYGNFCGVYQGSRASGLCDIILPNYCASVAMADPNCGCLLPPSYYTLPNSDQSYPECIDTRCYHVDTAYKTSIQVKTPCEVTICNDVDDGDNFRNISQNAINQYCGPEHSNLPTYLMTSSPSGPTTINGPPDTPPTISTPIWKNIYFWIVFFVVFIVSIGLIFFIINKNKTKKLQ
ncbi:putative virion-associated membrane protein [Tupanvirus deep ocean]|uniref:Virion-associated membrane protein n=2 Tax=Tupanvirus TaxID=2094720 RepID=A0AC62A8S8_9VIRU|nr:putative virion-associated membrane protein [Tupanvirus deep ocean]QKU34180.1 putative virion-associated membrane protein [Tupanvirus deep ocean]